MVVPPVEYRPRDPAGRVLYRIVRDHLETFRAEAARLRDGEGCQGSSRKSLEPSSGAGGSREGSRGSGVARAAWRMIDMLKRHEIQVLRRAGHTLTEVAQLSGVSVRTVQRG